MKFNFDLTTIEGRRKACEQFSEAMKNNLNGEHDEEACLVAYQYGEHSHHFGAGYSDALSELQARILSHYPSLIEPTLKKLPAMLIVRYLEGHDKEDEE